MRVDMKAHQLELLDVLLTLCLLPAWGRDAATVRPGAEMS